MRDVYLKVHNIYNEEYEYWDKLEQIEYNLHKDDKTDELYEYYFSDKIQELELIPLRIHRTSTLIIIYSYLEHTLRRICINLDKDISLHKIKYFDNCKEFIQEKTKSKFEEIFTYDELKLINFLRLLRNSLAHNEGYKPNDELKEMIDYHDGISMYSDTILIEHDFILKSFNITEYFLERLCKIPRQHDKP